MNQAPKVNDLEKEVLTVLADAWHEDYNCLNFNGIASRLKDSSNIDMSREEVRQICRALARKGLATYERGLFTEDGKVAGSGYSISAAGMRWLNMIVIE